jgi:hypothetical protein
MSNPWSLDAALQFTRQASNSFSADPVRGGGGGTGQVPQYTYQSAQNVELPDWLRTNPDANNKELLGAYGSIGKTFDPSGQVKAINDSIGYQTAAGTQAASNVASEYANRAMQSGGSTLGAGVVKAQSMLPVYAANAELRSKGADIVAQTREKAINKASEIGSALSQLRNSYLTSLAQFVQGQQQLGLETFRANSANFNDSENRTLESRRIALAAQAQQRPTTLPFLGNKYQHTTAGRSESADWQKYKIQNPNWDTTVSNF